ncbi:hypothetical protein CSB09_02115 [Candidatus Gracilibacteria bacterium]|nr:MAG: hypothetical protein CSB09_02115 [Candidatus Gracilibacteria bacterium]
MNHFSVSFPFIFVFAPCILVFWYVFFREKNGIALPNRLLAKFLKNPKSLFVLWGIRFFVIVLLLGIGADIHISGTRFVPSLPKKEVLVVLDISRSMLAEESGMSRIEESKQVIRNFVFDHPSYSFGLIVFAGKPFLLIASSQDSSGIGEYVSHISVNTIRQSLPGLSGTNIADALSLAAKSFDNESQIKEIILITDGEKNLGEDPIGIASQVARDNIKIHTIALVSRDPSKPLFFTRNDGNKEYLRDENGNHIYGVSNPKLLREISRVGNGQFFESRNLSELTKIFSDISHSSRQKNTFEKKYTHISLSPFLFLCFIGVLWGERLYTRRLFGDVYRGESEK